MMRLVHIVVIVCALTAFSCTETVNYCQAGLCPNGKQHIACTNPNGSFASICASNARILAISANLRQVILKEHNLLRNTIAKGGFSVFKAATRMATMQWNINLAKLAVLNVKQCATQHDSCRNTVKFKVGQNLASTASSGQLTLIPAIIKKLINAWFQEYKFASMAYIHSLSVPTTGKGFGHFTQVIQDKAQYIGCGILRQTKNGKDEMYLACNYSFPNTKSKPVYASGTSASKCLTGVNSNYKFLCSVKEVY